MRKPFLVFLIVITTLTTYSQGANINVESGHFQNWHGTYDTAVCSLPTPNFLGIAGLDTVGANPQHKIVSTGFDPCVTLGSLQMNNPSSGIYSVRLGDTLDACGASEMTYTFTIVPPNLQFSISYAAVFSDDGSHTASDAPRFHYSLTVCNGGYTIAADSLLAVNLSSDTSFHAAGSNPSTLYYLPWHYKCLDLTPWIGLCAYTTLKVTTSDCSSGTHRGYAYFDCQLGNCSGTMSIDQRSGNSNLFELFPNPPIEKFNLSYYSLENDYFEITLMNVQGCILQRDNFASGPGQISRTYKTEGLPKGLYFVNIKTKTEGIVQKKLIIN